MLDVLSLLTVTLGLFQFFDDEGGGIGLNINLGRAQSPTNFNAERGCQVGVSLAERSRWVNTLVFFMININRPLMRLIGNSDI